MSDKREDKDMETAKKEIRFEDYAPLNKDYSKKELAEIYKRIITDINSNKEV